MNRRSLKTGRCRSTSPDCQFELAEGRHIHFEDGLHALLRVYAVQWCGRRRTFVISGPRIAPRQPNAAPVNWGPGQHIYKEQTRPSRWTDTACTSHGMVSAATAV